MNPVSARWAASFSSVLLTAALATCQAPTPSPGLTFLDPMTDTSAALWDANGAQVHQWTFAQRPGVASYLDRHGNVLRSCDTGQSGPGFGGRVQRVALDGTVLWDYVPPLPGVQHHDIHELPNGNVLMIVTDTISRTQAIARGMDPAIAQELNADQLIEVRPTGPTTGEIVWRWRVLDHLIQQFDPTKPNFGVVADHPERIDINFPIAFPPPPAPTFLWMHMNAVDYNPALDQVVVSCRHWNELWILDHSTTTAEAATSSGGAHGKGGDLLYRWGNPATYGAPGPQQLAGQHDVHWIRPGRPGAGHLICFNNEKGSLLGLGAASAVTEIVTPVDTAGDYPRLPGAAFGPAAPFWEYFDPTPTAMYSPIVSSADRLPNGNTLVCAGTQQWVFELGLNDRIVWQVHPPLTFKARRDERALWASDREVATAHGDRVDFALITGTDHAFAPYVLGGSASGSFPGTQVLGVTLPLNVDAYLLTATGSALLPGSIGVLDGNGRASAAFVLPAGVGDPFAGTELHHAFLVLPGAGSPALASNAEPLTLVRYRTATL
ncbi:MAG: aryl-sulfate sulfotransferase [Planctomycetota bacterium]